MSKALPCFDLGVTWERKVTSPQSKIKHSCNLRFLKNLVQNLRRSGCDVQYLSEILNSCILSVSFKPPALNGIYIKVKIYSFIQTTRYFILTIEAVRSEERVFETESTIFLLKFLPISCFFFCFFFSRVITRSNWIYLPANYMFIFKRSQNNNFTSEAWLCSPKSGCYVYSVLASD